MSDFPSKKVAFLTRDLLFSSRVTGATANDETQVLVVSTSADLLKLVSASPVALVLIDLNTPGIDVNHLVPQLNQITGNPGAILAFGPHVHRAKLAAAAAAGCDQVLTRGEFDREMKNVLHCYL